MASHSVEIPISAATVLVSIIDTTSRAYHFPMKKFFDDSFPALESLDICAHSFLITHRDAAGHERNLIFDLGIRQDWQNYQPALVERIKGFNTEIEVKKQLVDILREGGTDPEQIEAVIWSHLHWDHIGDPSKFPASTKLIFGPGIREKFTPGWPANPNARFLETDLAGREVEALENNAFKPKIGGLQALDYFGDGSFYLLNAPGHSLGHLNALARTSSSPDTFIYMAADTVHFGGEFRPSKHLPLPEDWHTHVPNVPPEAKPRNKVLDIHPRHSTTDPFFGMSLNFPDDYEAAVRTVEALHRFDADERVLVVFAHDMSLLDVLDFYPARANDWKRKGWKEKGHWRFIAHLQKLASAADGKQGA